MSLATTACLKDAPLSSRSRLHISSKSFARVVSTLTTKDIQALLTQWVYVLMSVFDSLNCFFLLLKVMNPVYRDWLVVFILIENEMSLN